VIKSIEEKPWRTSNRNNFERIYLESIAVSGKQVIHVISCRGQGIWYNRLLEMSGSLIKENFWR
jgi:hypothetical protein